MIGETVEWLGAEHRLEKRAATPAPEPLDEPPVQ